MILKIQYPAPGRQLRRKFNSSDARDVWVGEDLEHDVRNATVAELKISFTTSYHDKINGLWTGTVTHCRYRDYPPAAVLAMPRKPMSHVQSQVS